MLPLLVLLMELVDMKGVTPSRFPLHLPITAFSPEDRSDAKALRRRHFSRSNVALREEDIARNCTVGLTDGMKRCSRGAEALIYAMEAPNKPFFQKKTVQKALSKRMNK